MPLESDDAVLDVMPTDPEILGFGNLWFTPAYQASEWVIVPNRGGKE
ncbi:MAG: hypothetical protein ACQ9MH_19030 [Nitrospinales bacterium]